MAAITGGNPALGVPEGVDSATTATSVTSGVAEVADTITVCVAAGTPGVPCSCTLGAAVVVGWAVGVVPVGLLLTVGCGVGVSPENSGFVKVMGSPLVLASILTVTSIVPVPLLLTVATGMSPVSPSVDIPAMTVIPVVVLDVRCDHEPGQSFGRVDGHIVAVGQYDIEGPESEAIVNACNNKRVAFKVNFCCLYGCNSHAYYGDKDEYANKKWIHEIFTKTGSIRLRFRHSGGAP